MPTEKAHGIQIIKMCEALALFGLEVELVLPWRFNKIKEDVFEYYQVKKSFKIKKMFSLDLVPLEIPRLGFWIQSLSFNLFSFFYLLFKQADIFYSRDSFSLYCISFFKENLVCEAHTVPKSFFLHKRVFKKARAIVVVTEKIKEELVKKGISENKVLVAQDGVDLDDFNIEVSKAEARKKLNLPLDKKIVLYAGLFDKWKGYLTLLEASKFFEKGVKLVMIGGTEKQVEKLRKEYPNVIFLGYLPYTRLPLNQKAADVLILPNSGREKVSKYWTSPLKLFSYMASGRPIVASDLPSLREVLNENNAYLVKPDSPEKLAQGVKRVLEGADFSIKISAQAHQDAQFYSWINRVKKIVNFIL